MSEQPPPYNPYDPNAQTPPPPPPPDYGQVPPPPPPPYGQVPTPPPAYGQPQHGQPPAYGQPQYGQPYAGYGYPQPTDNNGKAIASLVLGIVGFFLCPVIASITAIVLGISAKNDIKRSEGRMGGGGMATAGIVLGALGIIIGGLFLTLFITGVVHTANCVSNTPTGFATTSCS